MWNRVAVVLASIGFGVLMSTRSEFSNVTVRALIAAIAGGVAAMGWVALSRMRASR